MKALSAKTLPLNLLNEGESATVAEIRGGSCFRKKMADMGIVPNASISVVSGNAMSPKVVRIGETRVMLGLGILHKIMVTF